MTTEEQRKEFIKGEAERYLQAMLEARAAGGNLADYVDNAGMDALKNITGYVGDKVEAVSTPRGANYVPTVTELDANGRPVGYDLFSRLMKDRIVLLDGEVNDAMASIACASLLFLAHIDKDGSPIGGKQAPNIDVYINSPGGSVLAGAAIYDVMRSINAPVTTIGIGMQASMGSILLAAGDKRVMTRGSKLMIHSIGSGTQGKQAEQEISLDSARRLFEDMKAVYIRHIGLTDDFWDKCCAHDTWFSADQAKRMGFIDEIIVGDRKPAPFESAASAYQAFNAKSREDDVPKTEDGILDLLQATSKNAGKGERIRPELLVALAQMAKYQTPELQAKKAAQAAPAAPANQNEAPKASKKAAATGPKA